MATQLQIKQTTKETFHFINDPADAINEAAIGLTEHNANLSFASGHKIVYRNDLDTFRKAHVTTIGFAGGGHEPMFSGFVRPSFLSCSVSGNIFASPTAAQIFEAIKLCQPSGSETKGTLIPLVTKLCSFQLVVMLRSGESRAARWGDEGLSGHVVGLKIACGLVDQGESLERIGDVLEYIAANSGTIAVAFDRVALPNNLITEIQTLPPAIVEIGLGCHGESGMRQISPIPSPKDLTGEMNLLTDIYDIDRAFIPFTRNGTEEAILLVNSAGSTSDEVLARFAELAIAELASQGITVVRMTLGPMVTSLKQSGFGFTVWRLPAIGESILLTREEALQYWDRRVETVAWRQ